MEIKPVKRSKTPKYPTIEYYISNPEQLSKSIPNNWIKNKYVSTSLAAFILCGNSYSSKRIFSESLVVIDEKKQNDKPEIKQDNVESLKIAPIFAHGDGSGATGCIVMSPPVFISEDEAMKIILNAFKDENIEFDTMNCPSIKFKADPIANDCYEDDSSKIILADIEMKMDAYNANYNIGVQFVSEDDYFKFRSNDLCWSSVQGYDTKKAAEIIREELKENKIMNAVVFYDPLPSVSEENNYDWDAANYEAKNLLLAQVKDFIKWLKDENIIQ
jgi:hypothetical protein